MQCACGIPNRAAFHLMVIHGRKVPGGTETDCTDVYLCRRHGSPIETRDDVKATLRFDGADAVEIIEWELNDTGR